MKTKLISTIKQSHIVLQIYGYKLVYTLFYFLFQFFVVKVMSKGDFGHFSFYTSVVVYFGSFSLLGVPVYARRQIAKGKAILGSYLLIPLLNFVIGLGIVFWTTPASVLVHVELAAILTVSVCVSALTTVCNALEQYTEQYKMIVWMSMWNLACLALLVLGYKFSVALILGLWALNGVILLPILLIRYRKTLAQVRCEWDGWKAVGGAYLGLIFLYLGGFPFEFSRYFDKWIIKTTFSPEFLGIYAFNVLIVTSFVSLFIRPLEGILATRLAKVNGDSTAALSRIISQHYLKLLALYGGLFLYMPFSGFILKVAGLSQYIGTSKVFLCVFAFYVMYSLAAPFLILLNYTGSHKQLLAFFLANVGFFAVVFVVTRWQLSIPVFLVSFLGYQACNFLCLLGLLPRSGRTFGVSLWLVLRRLKATIWIFQRNLPLEERLIEP